LPSSKRISETLKFVSPEKQQEFHEISETSEISREGETVVIKRTSEFKLVEVELSEPRICKCCKMTVCLNDKATKLRPRSTAKTHVVNLNWKRTKKGTTVYRKYRETEKSGTRLPQYLEPVHTDGRGGNDFELVE